MQNFQAALTTTRLAMRRLKWAQAKLLRPRRPYCYPRQCCKNQPAWFGAAGLADMLLPRGLPQVSVVEAANHTKQGKLVPGDTVLATLAANAQRQYHVEI
jgi:hypothetical protein